MIYIHRFIYAIIFPLMAGIAAVIGILSSIVITPFYALIYYIVYGKLIMDIQIENMCYYITYPIFKFLEFIKPNE